ncbi:MAG: hypothetical protein WD035_01820, partial [Balneolaceae bacterium]
MKNEERHPEIRRPAEIMSGLFMGSRATCSLFSDDPSQAGNRMGLSMPDVNFRSMQFAAFIFLHSYFLEGFAKLGIWFKIKARGI